MIKRDIIRSMERYAGGGFITRQRLANYLGIADANRVKNRYLKDLDAVDGKYYFIPDVATVLMERRCNDCKRTGY